LWLEKLLDVNAARSIAQPLAVIENKNFRNNRNQSIFAENEL